MRFALFDAINETHVGEALRRALTSLGHEVEATGRLTTGFAATSARDVVRCVDAAIDRVIAAGCDALLNFRAASLSRTQARRLQAAGVRIAVWLPDDPVLYATTYCKVVDDYDVVLHCGTGRILGFYDARGHRPGVNFPFWVDPGLWDWKWRIEAARRELVFMGNLHGPAKAGRYAMLMEAGASVTVYGRCPADPAGIHAGELHGPDALRAQMPGFVAGLNIAQRFSDYAGTPYDFPGLAAMGSFDLPSRVIQYAAVGLPVISIGSGQASAHFPHHLVAGDVPGALELARGLRESPADAMALSLRARRHVEEYFSAISRARYLEALFGGRVDVSALDASEREYHYQTF